MAKPVDSGPVSTWLVTGGAGYIGAHVVRSLLSEGYQAVAFDDLSTGKRAFVPDGVPLIVDTILNTDAVTRALRDHKCGGVIHVAGYKYAGVSVRRPIHTFTQNVSGTASVLSAMAEADVSRLVFSSSAAVYGTPQTDIVTEDSPQHPESPYGESKLAAEWLINDVARAREGFQAVSLRYFNVVGSGTDEVYDASPHNLFPLVLEALLSGATPKIFGTDYPTPDGTCVRDYVHVGDLAVSHVAAAAALESNTRLRPAYNLGSGEGLSVRQIMEAMAEVTGTDFRPDLSERRAGDPARIVADGSAAAADLTWRMRYSILDMASSAWSARKASGPSVS